jgi:4-hydroxybenzoate polyprenyltransferase
MKRHTHMPQLVLGLAFSMGIPMAFAAQINSLPPIVWLLYTGATLWTLVYDTFYAMVDRDDDVRIGVKSTAILFGDDDKHITAVLQLFVLIILGMAAFQFKLGSYVYLSLIGAAGLFSYQQHLIREREREACFKAFLNNNYVGMVIFIGIALDYALPSLLT